MADRSGFDEFVSTRSHRLLRTAYLLTRDWAAAEDLLQESMTKAWFAWPRVHGDPEPYVRKIIARSFVSMYRRRWRGELPAADFDDRASSLTATTTADAIGASDERDALWRALGRLPARQRAVVVLRYYEDMSEAEVAESLRCSAGTVKSQAAKALAKLRADTTIGPDRTSPGKTAGEADMKATDQTAGPAPEIRTGFAGGPSRPAGTSGYGSGRPATAATAATGTRAGKEAQR